MNEDYLKKLGDDIALAHWAQPGEKTYEEIVDRVVNYICDDTSDEGRHYNSRMKDLLKQKKFLPNSPCWINAGTDMKNLFACYVVDLQDNMSSIMDTAKRMAMIMKEGGGVGVSLTPIRREGSHVGGEGSNRTASGPISFLKVFDAVVGAVKSAGVRRGAALANLKTGHPDIIKFIKCKEDQNQINNFNLSVAITDEFMNDVMTDSYKVWAKDEEGAEYTASDIYEIIVEHMWNNGEPGVQFIDTVNNVDGKYTGRPEFKQYNTDIEVSNPCGETFLKPNEACNLGSINLYHFVNPFWNGHDDKKDMALKQELKQTVEDAVEFLNKMLDKSVTPFDDINAAVKASRKVGLGVMGLADYLSAKGLRYGSPEAVHETEDLFNFITTTAEDYSLKKGYKNATLTVQAPTGTTGLVGEASTGIEPHFLRCWTRHSLKMGDLLMYPKSLRDYILYSYEHRDPNDTDYLEISALYSAIDKGDFNMLDERLQIKDGSRAMQIRRMWPTAHEVHPVEHLLMLAAVQRNVHNSVSKTINLPHDATVEDVKELITMAWDSGCKGFTCYRDGSRDSQPLKSIDRKDSDKKFEEIKKSIESGETAFIPRSEYDELLRRAKILEELNDSVDFDLPTCVEMVRNMRKGKETIIRVDEYEQIKRKAAAFDKLNANLPPTLMPKEYALAKDINVPCKRPRPNITFGETVKTKIGCGSIYITVNKDENGTCEVFTNLGRAGGCPSQSEATCRLISLALRSGVNVEDVIDQLKGIRCMNTMRQGGIKQPDGTVVLSCPDAIGKVIEKFHKANEGEGLYVLYEEQHNREHSGMTCPDCGKPLARDGGCVICRHCGYSKCG